MKVLRIAAFLAGVSAHAMLLAQGAGTEPEPNPEPNVDEAPLLPYQEYAKRVKSAQTTSPLSSDLFGENISLYNGATEFSATDIDVPGNNGLPVRLSRTYTVQTKRDSEVLGGFGSWDLDVPYIHGTFIDGWGPTEGGTGRCSQFGRPLPPEGSIFDVSDFWSGTKLHLPGQGDMEILRLAAAHPVPTSPPGATFLLGTKALHRIRCKPNTDNGFPGEGFIVVDTSGTTYTFDVGLQRFAGMMEKQGSQSDQNERLGRTEVYLMVRLIEDRFGNTVTYQWNGNQLTSITASDGRSIALAWDGRHIVSATAADRTWHYHYADPTGIYVPGAGPGNPLIGVTLPDASSWTYTYSGVPMASFLASNDNNASGPLCLEPFEATGTFSMSITHPSGATGDFHFEMMRHRRSGIPRSACVQYLELPKGVALFQLSVPDYFDVFSARSKTVSGPGLETQLWTYEYEIIPNGRTDTEAGPLAPCAACQDTKSVYVHRPDGSIQEHRFGVLWQGNDGRLLGVYTRKPNRQIVRAETHSFVTESEAASMPFPNIYGFSHSADDELAVKIRPLRATTVAQDGVIAEPAYFEQPPPPPVPGHLAAATFSHSVNSFDAFARATSVRKFNSLGFDKSETTGYRDDIGKWVLNLVESHSVNGIVAATRTYYPGTLQLWTRSSFGVLQETYTYNNAIGAQNGTVASVTDGNTTTTHLENWHRGVPQLIRYPDTPPQSAVVNGSGWIKSVTDPLGATTAYAHDDMGRTTRITHPEGGSVAWNATDISFQKNPNSEFGLPAGHWKHVTQTGTAADGYALNTVYLDALWRPLLAISEASNVAQSRSIVVKRYDALGRAIFASYPVSSLTHYQDPLLKGVTTEYDGLDRVTRVLADSESEQLSTVTTYPGGLSTRVTNPRGHTTTTSYQAFDSPSYDSPLIIQAPEGVTTTITRDVFGKPLTTTRSGPSG
jgi:YD repeat-containing protein